MIGNAVPVNLAKFLASRIKAQIESKAHKIQGKELAVEKILY